MTRVKLMARFVIEKDDLGFYGTCRDLGCIHVFGDTEVEALSAAKDAFDCYLEMSIANGDPIPEEIVIKQPKRKQTGQIPSKAHQEIIEYTRVAPAPITGTLVTA